MRLASRNMRPLAAALAAAFLGAVATGARAQAAAPSAPCADFSSASPQAVEPALGIAECHAAAGRTASAYVAFAEAARLAAAEHDARFEVAERRLRELQPQLVSLRITINAEMTGVTVLRDGAGLRPEELDKDIHVDPGTHIIMALAPGRQAWSQSIDMREPGRHYRVEVPVLAAVVTPPQVAEVQENRSSGRLFLYALVTGMVSLTCPIAGIASLVEAGKEREKARYATDPKDAKHWRDRARSSEVAAGVVSGVGVVFAGITTILAVIIARDKAAAPAKPANQGVAFAPWVLPGSGGVVVEGSF